MKKHTILTLSFICVFSFVAYLCLGSAYPVVTEGDNGTLLCHVRGANSLFCEFRSLYLDEDGILYAQTNRDTIVAFHKNELVAEYKIPEGSNRFYAKNKMLYFQFPNKNCTAAYNKEGVWQSDIPGISSNIEEKSELVSNRDITYRLDSGRLLCRIIYQNGENQKVIITRGSETLKDIIKIALGSVVCGTWIVIIIAISKKRKRKN